MTTSLLYAACTALGVVVTFWSIGWFITQCSDPYDRATNICLMFSLELCALVLVSLYWQSILPFLFTYAFTKALMYSISDLENILFVQYIRE